MKRMLAISSMIFCAVVMIFSTGGRQAGATGHQQPQPGCIVQPDVIERCEQSGGRFDWGLCSCVGGSALTAAK